MTEVVDVRAMLGAWAPVPGAYPLTLRQTYSLIIIGCATGVVEDVARTVDPVLMGDGWDGYGVDVLPYGLPLDVHEEGAREVLAVSLNLGSQTSPPSQGNPLPQRTTLVLGATIVVGEEAANLSEAVRRAQEFDAAMVGLRGRLNVLEDWSEMDWATADWA